MIEECEEASARSRIGDMYKCLRRLGTRERPAARSMKVTVDEFNPLTPRRTLVAPFTKISILF